jgi:hypothetical protein
MVGLMKYVFMIKNSVTLSRAAFNPPWHLTAAPLGSRTVQVICQRFLQPTGRFLRRSLSAVVR